MHLRFSFMKYVPADLRGSSWALVRSSYAATHRIVSAPELARRRKAQRALHAPVTIPRDKGYLLCPPEQFAGTSPVIDQARTLALRADEAADWSRKAHMTNLLPDAALTLDSPWLQFALRPDVLAIISNYLGVVPIINQVWVFYSRHVPQPASSSQLYHQDTESPSQVKIFMFCNDVTPANGPLTVIDATTSRRLSRMSGYWWRPGRRTSQDLSKYMDPVPDDALLGPAGTVVFADTDRCFHYGSRIEEGAAPRLVTTWQYLTPLSFRNNARFRHLAGAPHLTSLQRLALGGAPENR